MLFKAVTGKDRNVFYIAPTQKQARSIIWEALKSRIGTIGEANESRLEMRVPTACTVHEPEPHNRRPDCDNGFSTIFVAGWENRENFRGMKAYHITFDEVDTLKDFFIGWQEIFRPALIDTSGTADFIGTPKKENPNLRRLEKEADYEWASFQFATGDNPHIPPTEIEAAKKDMDADTYRQEILAEYVENAGALFRYTALIDAFSNAVEKSAEKYLIIDVADDGSDKTKFSFWQGLEEYRRETFQGLNSEAVIMQAREYQGAERIPMSQTLVDAIGVGAAIASSSLLDGIIGFKGSYAPIRTEASIVALPNVHYIKEAPLVTDYKNLRSQCVFKLAEYINTHKIGSKVTGRDKEAIIAELSTYQDVSKGDGKRFATPKEDVAEIIGHSPDDSDTWIMRMYFVLRASLSPHQSEDTARINDRILAQLRQNESRVAMRDTR